MDDQYSCYQGFSRPGSSSLTGWWKFQSNEFIMYLTWDAPKRCSMIHLFHKERRSIIISSSLYLPVKRMCQKKTKKSLASICPYLAWKRYVFFVRYVAPLYSLKNLYYNKMSFQEAFFFSRCNAWALFLFLLNAKEYKEFKVRANILYSQRWESFQWWM